MVLNHVLHIKQIPFLIDEKMKFSAYNHYASLDLHTARPDQKQLHLNGNHLYEEWTSTLYSMGIHNNYVVQVNNKSHIDQS